MLIRSYDVLNAGIAIYKPKIIFIQFFPKKSVNTSINFSFDFQNKFFLLFYFSTGS